MKRLPNGPVHRLIQMDHLSRHKIPGAKEAIESASATVKHLPKYSTDLDPIELFFSKLKALLRKAAERTVPGLWRKIAKLLKTITRQECMNYFRHAGYGS